MSLVLATHGQLLQTNFPRVRNRLVGVRLAGLPQRSATIKKLKAYSIVVLRFVLFSIIITACLVIGSLVIPELSSRLFSDTQEGVFVQAGEQHVEPSTAQVKKPIERPVDATLPQGTWIRIPSIGVNTQARPLQNADEALAEGAWMVPDFGRPGDETQPTIMAAHRYGWKWWWQSDYWKLNSFYLLTETKPGDTIEVVSDQKKYIYEIYASGEGEEITDYSADLILYTCKFMNSPIRYFRYAKLHPYVDAV